VKDNLIGVTGATGELGGLIVARLAERGVAQRLIVRNPSRASELPGAEVARASSHGDGEEMRRALEGVRTLFPVSAGEAFDRVKLHTTAVGAVVAAGVERVVYLSFLNAAPDATFTFARDHFHTEEYVRSTGVRHALLRPSICLSLRHVFLHRLGRSAVTRSHGQKAKRLPLQASSATISSASPV